MPAPYSTAFRREVVAAVESGDRKSDVCRRFGISRNTLDLWLKQLKVTGSIAPRKYRHGPVKGSKYKNQ